MIENTIESVIETNLKNPKLDIFHVLKENQLFRINEPEPGIFIAESPYVIERAIEAGYEPISFLVEKEQFSELAQSIIRKFQVPCFVIPHSELKDLVGYRMTRGLLCAMKRKKLPGVEDVCKDKNRIVVLENIVNPTNTGAIIRSAAALGAEGMLLTKGCADPLQRRSSRVSMGNVFFLDWTFMDTYRVDVKQLKSLGFKTIAMALTEQSIPLDKIEIQDEKIAIIMGTEGDGLCKETIDSCDIITKIPMSLNVDSLNVAAASAVAFWELCRPQPNNR